MNFPPQGRLFSRFCIVKTGQLRYNPFVRLDLFLKSSRLVKRRTIGQEMCDAGRVQVNGQAAKPAKEIKPGDRLALTFVSRVLEVEILAVPVSAKNVKAPPEELYRVVSEQRTRQEHI
jgi:ribosomal 50S subunit-recycling heat shock protein